MPCLHTESLPTLPADGQYGVSSARRGSQGSRSKSGKKAKSGEKLSHVERNDSEKEQSVITSAGWFFTPLWTSGTKTQRLGFRVGKESEKVKAWLDDHSDFARSYFSRSSRYWMNGCVERAHAAQTHITEPRTRMTVLGRRRVSHPLCGPSRGLVHPATMERPHSCLSMHQIDNSECLDQGGGRFSRSVQSTQFPFSQCVSRSRRSNSLYSQIPAVKCGKGESCDIMMQLFATRPLQDKNIYTHVLQHLCEITQAQYCSLSVATVDKTGVKCLGPVFQSDEESVYSYTQTEWDKSIMGHVVSTGRPINIRDAHEDPRFQFELCETGEDKPKSFLSVPILNHKKEVIGVVMAVNKSRPGTCYGYFFSEQDEKVLSSHMLLFGLILENSQLCESSELESKRNLVLLELAQLVSHDFTSVDDMLSKLAAIILPVTKAQFCTVFISGDSSTRSFSKVLHIEHKESDRSVECSTRDCDSNDTDYMYAVHVQNSMETLNIVSRPAQISKVYEIRSLIGTPLRGKQRGNVIGVCQLVNKRDVALAETEVFSQADEHLLEDFAVYCALGLQKINTQQTADKTRARLAVTKEVLSYHVSTSQEEINDLEEAAIPSADALSLLDFGFSDFNMSQTAMTQAVVRMFLDLNLLQEFSIDYKTLCQWVLSIRKCYRSNVIYHNWNHALRTVQCMFAMLQTKELKSHFSSLEVLALMIASLSHDLDHRGVNNSYIERSNHSLAQLYGHSSLEYHHYDMCLLILNNPGSQILSSLSVNEYTACVQMIEKNILATDLVYYIEKRARFFKLAQNSSCLWKDEGHKELLRSMLMTASDICAITKPWPVQKRIAELVATEFYAQGDREKCEFNTQPIDVMDREKSSRLPHMQVDYIDGICSPLYEALASICESCSPLREGCRKNRKHWQQLAESRKKNRGKNEHQKDDKYMKKGKEQTKSELFPWTKKENKICI